MLRWTTFLLCKAGTRRWPVACFYNMLDLCAIKAWILYKETTGSKISRRKLMLHLIDQLCRNVPNENMTMSSNLGQLELNMKPSRRKCQNSSCGNKTSNQCEECKKFYCGEHITFKVQSFYCINCSK